MANSICGKALRPFAKTVGLAFFTAIALAQSTRTPEPTSAQAHLVVPIFGPGIAGNVSEGPTVPVCGTGVPCTRPFANAILLILDQTTRALVGKAQSNSSGNFIVSVPEGGYVVHVMTVDFPFCPEESVTVAVHNFSLTQINCDTGIR